MNRKPWARLALLIVFALSLTSSPIRSSAQATPVAGSAAALEASVGWLQSQQADDGGWVGFSGTSDVGVTIDAVLALVAASNRGVPVDLAAARDFILANGVEYAGNGTGAAAKLVMAAVALGLDPTGFNGENLIEELESGFNGQTNLYGLGIYDHALFILAMAAAGQELPEGTIEAVAGTQLEEGSWAFDGTKIVGNGDTNTTAIVIQALVAANRTEGDLIMHGLEYLAGVARPEGFSFQPGPGAIADANSTALVVQALIAAGEDPAGQEWQNGAGALLAFQNESGAFSYQLDPRDENLYATVQAIPAIADHPFPVSVSGESTPVALVTCTVEQLATPETDAQLPCAA